LVTYKRNRCAQSAGRICFQSVDIAIQRFYPAGNIILSDRHTGRLVFNAQLVTGLRIQNNYFLVDFCSCWRWCFVDYPFHSEFPGNPGSFGKPGEIFEDGIRLAKLNDTESFDKAKDL